MEYPEEHKEGVVFLENLEIVKEMIKPMKKVDFGLQVSKDGRVWVCINGIAFIRFTPHTNKKMFKD